MPWTVPQVTTHPVGPWILPQATSWRQALAGELSQLEGSGSAVLAGPTLALWLRESGRSTSLQLATCWGGPAASPELAYTWLGLSHRAETEPVATRALRELEADLGALLDAWRWYTAPEPSVPPFLDEPCLYLAAAVGSVGAEGPMGPTFGNAALARVMQALKDWPGRLGLHGTITPAVADLALVQAAEQAARQAVASDDRSFPWDASPLTEQALRLHEQVTASLLQLRLCGATLPGRALRTWMEAALSSDLGLDLRFQEEPATLTVHGSRALRLLEMLGQRTGVDLSDDEDDAVSDREPPF